MELIATVTFGDMIANYYTCDGNLEWVLVPAKMSEKIQLMERLKKDSLIQAKLVGDDYPKGFSTGHTMRNSKTTKMLNFIEQQVTEDKDGLKVDSIMEDYRGNQFIHHVQWNHEYPVLKTWTTFRNQTAQTQKLELLSSFSLSCLSPFSGGNEPGTLELVRYRSKWSSEGRRLVQPIEDLQLEPSWKPSGVGLEKFGQIGSMPVRGYFPYAAVTDKERQVSWAVRLAIPGSWQMEAYRLDEDLCLSGGLADRDYGDWLKEIEPGESFDTPPAYLTVAIGQESEASQRLTSIQRDTLKLDHASEVELAVQFNDFCTTWGKPTEHSVTETLNALKGKGIKYYVIDAGWYADPKFGWERSHGDWILNEEQFPNGLEPVLDKIRDAGMIPGIWFEIETVGRDSKASHLSEHLLKRDGIPMTCGDRRFWDMRDPWVQDYLFNRIISFLKEYNFGYLKIDYNENFGRGFDDSQLSMGEAGRQTLEASQSFIRRIKDELPDLVIENCSSGGHRLEPSMMALTDLSSFSDAHEAECIPIIAANLHHHLLPQQSLIWAVLRKKDTLKRLYYSMSATFLGRICLSGDVQLLDKEQWQVVSDALSYYEEVRDLLTKGLTEIIGKPQQTYRELTGYQVVLRKGAKKTLAVIHQFDTKEILLPKRIGEIQNSYGIVNQGIVLNENEDNYMISFPEQMMGCSILFNRH